ncbi:Mitochondrial basic amino acids transporter [Hypsibius exemplaris]|uniref:Mitochondrial basic amino acids transporter n=1 Tax=Hypsibius exemplaris TaxID=2072580 RepID=A0A1W0WAC8_HYPEX|nr:Mitochondrial basic amino acids transporter [Hypsibius exemplaris]
MDPVLADFVAGTLGGCAGVIVGYPLDTVKVRLQTQSAAAPLYKGTYHCLSTIVKNESFWGMYKGMSSPLCGVAVINAIVFGVYGNSMRYLQQNTLTNNLIAGSFAGAVQSLISCPMELAKTKMQLQGVLGPDPMNAIKSGILQKPALYRSPVDCLWKLYSEHGLRTFYRGFWVTIAREVPGFGSYFFSYEYLTRIMTPHGTFDARGNYVEGQLGIGRLMMAGGLSGIISWLVSFPQDVVKSRYQADEQYTSARQCMVMSYRTEGAGVFARGLWSTILRAFPTNAATLTVVTLFLRYVGDLNDDKYLQGMML